MDDFIDVEEFLHERNQEINKQIAERINAARPIIKEIEPEGEQEWETLERLFKDKVQTYWKEDAELFPLASFLAMYPIMEQHPEYSHGLRGMMALAAWLGPFKSTYTDKKIPPMLDGYLVHKFAEMTRQFPNVIWWTLYDMHKKNIE